MMKIPMLGRLRGLKKKAKAEYLINVRHVPRDSREVGGSCTYLKPGGRVVVVKSKEMEQT